MSGAELKAARKSLGMTQGQLALRLGVTANTVARWERDEVPIPHPQMVRLALAALAAEREG